MSFKLGDKVMIKNAFFKEGDNTFGYSGIGVVVKEDHKEFPNCCCVQWEEDEQDHWYYFSEIERVDASCEIDNPSCDSNNTPCEVNSTPTKIKSDGGSSSYYDLPIDDKLLETLMSRYQGGECYVKTEELIHYLFDDSFVFGTAFKSLVRALQETRGGGKEGNSLEYECNKVAYYADSIKKFYGEGE